RARPAARRRVGPGHPRQAGGRRDGSAHANPRDRRAARRGGRAAGAGVGRARARRRPPRGRHHPLRPARPHGRRPVGEVGDGAVVDRDDLDDKGFGTRAVHGAGPPDPGTGAVVPPISLASTFAQEAVGQPGAFEYSRSGNPTRAALEAHLAALEHADHGFAFASGLAAEDALLRLLSPGEHAVFPDDAYGGTIRLAQQVHVPTGLQVDYADLTDVDALVGAFRENTRIVWMETPSNP